MTKTILLPQFCNRLIGFSNVGKSCFKQFQLYASHGWAISTTTKIKRSCLAVLFQGICRLVPVPKRSIRQQCSELAHRKDVAHIEKMGKRKLTVESPVNLDIRTDRVVALVEFRAPITWRVWLRCSFLPTHNVIKILWKKISQEENFHWNSNRSEERRVGKECRSRWSPYH